MDYMGLVFELNQEIFNKYGEVDDEFNYITNGYVDMIKFGDVHLWNSDDDGREWNEDENDYEPLKPYLLKVLKAYGKKLVKLGS